MQFGLLSKYPFVKGDFSFPFHPASTLMAIGLFFSLLTPLNKVELKGDLSKRAEKPITLVHPKKCSNKLYNTATYRRINTQSRQSICHTGRTLCHFGIAALCHTIL